MNKKNLLGKTAFLPVLVALGMLAGCPGSRPRPDINLAVVPGADVAIKADLQALVRAPFSLKDFGLPKKDTQPLAEACSNVLAAMNLSEKDLLAVLMTYDLDTFSINNNEPPDLENASLALAVKLGKPATIERFQAGVQAALGDDHKVHEALVLERKAIFVNPPSPGAPTIYGGISKDGLILFATLNKSAMEEVYRRESMNAPVALPEGLAKIAGEVSNSQAQAAVFLPESMRQGIHERMEKQKDTDNMAIGMAISIAQSITSASLGFSLAENLEARLCLGFNDATVATRTFDLLQGSVLAMFKLMAAMDRQAMPFDPDKALICTHKEGSEFVNLVVTLSEAELRSCLDKYGK